MKRWHDNDGTVPLKHSTSLEAEGSHWSDSGVKCLFKIWTDKNIQSQLHKSLKKSKLWQKSTTISLVVDTRGQLNKVRTRCKKWGLNWEYGKYSVNMATQQMKSMNSSLTTARSGPEWCERRPAGSVEEGQSCFRTVQANQTKCECTPRKDAEED